VALLSRSRVRTVLLAARQQQPPRAGERYAASISNIVLRRALAELRRHLVQVGMADAPPGTMLLDHFLAGADLW
jgi:hypothetical protein